MVHTAHMDKAITPVINGSSTMKAICKKYLGGGFVARSVEVEVIPYVQKPWNQDLYAYTVVSPSGSRVTLTLDGFNEYFDFVQ
jgi:hypothetical protein